MSLPSPVLRVEAFGYLKRVYILASPGYALGTIAVNVTWMERGFNVSQTHRIMYPSMLNRFPVIQPVSSRVRHFSTFLHTLASPGYAARTIAVNVTRLERGFNACKTPRCIYLSINHFWDIASYWSLQHFHTPPLFSSPAGGDPVKIPRRSWSTQN